MNAVDKHGTVLFALHTMGKFYRRDLLSSVYAEQENGNISYKNKCITRSWKRAMGYNFMKYDRGNI